jgi:hypothetical protein
MQKVYFCDSRAVVSDPARWYQPQLSLVNKLKRLIDESGVLDIISGGDLVAIKTHFGERGTTKTLRSTFIRAVVEKVKEAGGKPFVTETTGLGLTRLRSTAVGRLLIAEENGYTQQTLSAPIIIADGLNGYDDVVVEIEGKYLGRVHVAKAIAEADAVICCTHFKLHMQAGIGGSLKNVGVGCVAKQSKFDIHIARYPKIMNNCTRCGKCVDICPSNAIQNFQIIEEKCIKCTGCYEVCDENAVEIRWLVGPEVSYRVVECAAGVLNLNSNFSYLNFLIDITPHCDCHPYSDIPVVPDLGIFASKDIVAIDRASLDMYTEADVIKESILAKHRFWEWTDSVGMLEYAEKLGLGSSDYEIVKIE